MLANIFFVSHKLQNVRNSENIYHIALSTMRELQIK